MQAVELLTHMKVCCHCTIQSPFLVFCECVESCKLLVEILTHVNDESAPSAFSLYFVPFQYTCTALKCTALKLRLDCHACEAVASVLEPKVRWCVATFI